MYRDRLQAAQLINLRLEFDGSTADDIRRAAILYLSDLQTYLEERERHGSSVEDEVATGRLVFGKPA